MIVESVQIQAGVYAASAGWLRALRAWTREHGVVLIVDEVQAGCGRTGDFFGFEHAGIVPDIVTCAKSIGGFGLPLALNLIAPELDVWQPGQHTGTFRGNQLAFITAAVALRRWRDPAFRALVRANCAIMAAAGDRMRAASSVAAYRCQGMIAGIDLGLGGAERAHAVQARCLEAGVLVERCGPNGEVVKLMPPITIPTADLARGLDAIAAALDG